MSGIRGLETLFDIEKNNFNSKEDCIILVLHSMFINEGLQCSGTGDEWPQYGSETTTELLPKGWNRGQDVYLLRYVNKDGRCRVLLKIVKANHLLLINSVVNEDVIATVSVPVGRYVSDNYEEYSTAYKNLESLKEIFWREIIEDIFRKLGRPSTSTKTKQKTVVGSPPRPSTPNKPRADEMEKVPGGYSFPDVGGRDLDPLGRGQGGMLMDPSSFGIPGRPSLTDLGVGGPGGLPRGSVPPGARFDPLKPPIRPSKPNPDPDHLQPPEDSSIY